MQRAVIGCANQYKSRIEVRFQFVFLFCSVPMNDLKKVKLNLDNMFNEKSRVEKSEKGKKSKGKGKARLRVEENDMVCISVIVVMYCVPFGGNW